MIPAKKYWLLCAYALVASACSYLGDPFLAKNAANELVETPDYLSLRAPGATPAQGLLFYPGGLVDPHAYLEWLDELLSRQPGIQAVVARMPANLAVFSPEKALRLQREFPWVRQWVIAGHSLGGAMACRAARKNPFAFDALVLLAAYPAEADALSDWDRPVLSMYATADGLATPADIEERENLLPPRHDMRDIDDFPTPLAGRALYFAIQGGNHSQFGSYGPQNGDGAAAISREIQHDIMVRLIIGLFQRLP